MFKINNKVLVFSIIGILIIIIAITLVFFIKKGEKEEQKNIQKEEIKGTGEQTKEDKEVAQNNSRLKLIFKDPVFKVIPQDDGLLIFTSSGEILQSDFDGQGIKKMREGGGELIRVVVSNNNSEAIFTEINTDNEIIQKVINLKSFKEFKLIPNIFSPVFSPAGDKIAFHYYDPSGAINNISLSNLDGSNIETIFELNMYDIDLSWPEGDYLYIFSPSSYLVKSSLYILDIVKGVLRASNIFGSGLIVKGEEKGILYSTVNNRGKDLKLYFSNLDNLLELPLKTLPNKCQFTRENILICAEPINIKNETLPDDYFKKKFYSVDEFVKFDFFDKTIEKIAGFTDLEKKQIDAIELSMSEKYLFFINRKNNKLYRLEL